METTRPEPKVRRDGRCLVCRKPRIVPRPLQRGVPEFVYLRDPFCSAICSRKYYGTSLTTKSEIVVHE